MTTRKLIVLLTIGAVMTVASIWSIANWLTEVGAVEFANWIKVEFLTGTAIAVIAVILFVVPGTPWPRGRRAAAGDRWPFE